MGHETDTEEKQERSPYGLLFKQLSMAFSNTLRREAARYDLTPAQAMVLIYLSKTEHKVNQRELEAYYRLSNPTVTGLMKRMEAKGFIQREVSKEDGRFKHIMLTPKATEVVNDVQNNLARVEKSVVKGMSPEEQELFYDLLERALDSIGTIED